MEKENKNKILIPLLILLGMFLFNTPLTLAENKVQKIEKNDQSANLVNCFKYYKFNSVQVSLEHDKENYQPGENVRISGELVNENNYPIVNGTLFIRVARRNQNYIQDGDFIIDEFIAQKNITIDAKKTKEISFNYKIPQASIQSKYIISYFFSVGNKFNLAGLPFTNEVTGGNIIFNVKSNNNQSLFFDRSKTKVNSQRYHHIGNWPVFEKGQSVTIEQPLVNTFNKDKEVNVKYELYYWDSLNNEDLISAKGENLNIKAHNKVILKYDIPKIERSVYYLKITAVSGEQKSIINIRLASNQEEPRINYPAITKFPLKQGDEFTLFTCFHNTSSIDTNGKVNLELINKDNNKKVAELNYQGIITSAMSATAKKFKAKKGYDHLILKAKLYNREGKVVDKYTTEYNCEDFNTCQIKKNENKFTQSFSQSKNQHLLLKYASIILSIILIVTGLALAVKYYQRNK